MAHSCHAEGCSEPCAPERLMCLGHWRAVPAPLAHAVNREYRVGQCNGSPRPSRAWVNAARAAIAVVAEREVPDAKTK